MKQSLLILLVGDDDEDARLIELALRGASFSVQLGRVRSEEELRRALTMDHSWDVIVSDSCPPRLDALSVLDVIRQARLAIPVIAVSRPIGDEAAVGLLRAGASDFILKTNLTRLVPALEQAMQDSRRRREQQLFEERIMRTERLAGLGMITTGVAHEINNPLGLLVGALGVIDEAARTAPAHEREAKTLREITVQLASALDAAYRIKQIVRDVRTFSRFVGVEPPAAVNLSKVISSSLRLASSHLRPRARVEEHLEETPPVLAHEGKLIQVLLNLFINAAHAMPAERYEDNKLVVRTRVCAGSKVEIAVSDTGCGIPPERLDQIFEPFFTTKPAELGTGLGLAICRRIVEQLGGNLVVESELGKGSTFRVILPACSSGAPTDPFGDEASTPLMPLPRGTS